MYEPFSNIFTKRLHYNGLILFDENVLISFDFEHETNIFGVIIQMQWRCHLLFYLHKLFDIRYIHIKTPALILYQPRSPSMRPITPWLLDFLEKVSLHCVFVEDRRCYKIKIKTKTRNSVQTFRCYYTHHVDCKVYTKFIPNRKKF